MFRNRRRLVMRAINSGVRRRGSWITIRKANVSRAWRCYIKLRGRGVLRGPKLRADDEIGTLVFDLGGIAIPDTCVWCRYIEASER